MSQGIYTIVANYATVFVVYHFSRPLVDKLWHSVVDGLGDGSGYLRSELAILHHLTRGVQCQAKEGRGCQVQPERIKNQISRSSISLLQNSKVTLLNVSYAGFIAFTLVILCVHEKGGSENVFNLDRIKKTYDLLLDYISYCVGYAIMINAAKSGFFRMYLSMTSGCFVSGSLTLVCVA